MLLGILGIGLALSFIFFPDGSPLLNSLGFGILGSVIAYHMIPALGPSFIKVGFSGKDLSKKDKPLLPECMGAVPVTVYLFCMIFFIPFMFFKYLVTMTSGGGNREQGIEVVVNQRISSHLFPHNKLAEYLSALMSLQSMFMLGVADDLFDIRWRNKFFLPAIAAIPLLIVYYVDFGVTHVMLPPFLNLGATIDLGAFYYAYMAAVAIFCPNAINIYAGVNGLEVGQSVVIGILILINDLLYILPPSNHPAVESHLFSTYLVLPFLGVSLSLLYYNWFPAKVFVGDTYCYFAGMVFAVVGIMGHFSKTLLLFFIPQIFNFVYSVPQLLPLVNCPRHRLPRLNLETGLLEPSRAILKDTSTMVVSVLEILESLRLIQLWRDQKTGEIVECSNFTLINLVLVTVGPLREDSLASVLLAIQFVTGIGAIIVRHTVAILIFGRDNL